MSRPRHLRHRQSLPGSRVLWFVRLRTLHHELRVEWTSNTTPSAPRSGSRGRTGSASGAAARPGPGEPSPAA